MAADYRGLGFDPTPGVPDAVDAAATRCARAAEHAATAAEHSSGTPGWSGRAADAFAARFAGVGSELARAQEVLGAAARVLDDWSSQLRANQRATERLDRLALDLRRAIDTAADDLSAARTALQVALGSAARTAEAALAAAVDRRDRLAAELARVIDQAHDLEREHRAAAARTADQLHALDSDHPTDLADPEVDTLFDGIARSLGTHSAHTAELANTLLGPGHPLAPTLRTPDSLPDDLGGHTPAASRGPGEFGGLGRAASGGSGEAGHGAAVSGGRGAAGAFASAMVR